VGARVLRWVGVELEEARAAAFPASRLFKGKRSSGAGGGERERRRPFCCLDALATTLSALGIAIAHTPRATAMCCVRRVTDPLSSPASRVKSGRGVLQPARDVTLRKLSPTLQILHRRHGLEKLVLPVRNVLLSVSVASSHYLT
jgi:hypothetical protein